MRSYHIVYILVARCFIAYCQFPATFCSAARKNFSSVFGCHTCAKPVLVAALSAAWLKCTFHCILPKKILENMLVQKIRTTKICISFVNKKNIFHFLLKGCASVLGTPLSLRTALHEPFSGWPALCRIWVLCPQIPLCGNLWTIFFLFPQYWRGTVGQQL